VPECKALIGWRILHASTPDHVANHATTGANHHERAVFPRAAKLGRGISSVGLRESVQSMSEAYAVSSPHHFRVPTEIANLYSNRWSTQYSVAALYKGYAQCITPTGLNGANWT
jgi:hypothetical protein